MATKEFLDTTLKGKLDDLRSQLSGLGTVAVAFSGGVDSSLLLYLAHEQLADGCLAVTARSCSFPERELAAALAFCERYGIGQEIVDSEELEIEGFADNPPERCYLCKSELFAKIRALADTQGLAAVAEGSNLDDDGDYRPGLKAIREQGVLSPLRKAGLSKSDIRALSSDLGLPTADKPSFACLASRFPFGEAISPDALKRVEVAEQLLLDLGFRQVRVRNHGRLARIEVDEGEIEKLLDPTLRTKTHTALKGLGYDFVSLDLAGYQTGSMNATLP
jgi:uncharacterized protein